MDITVQRHKQISEYSCCLTNAKLISNSVLGVISKIQGEVSAISVDLGDTNFDADTFHEFEGYVADDEKVDKICINFKFPGDNVFAFKFSFTDGNLLLKCFGCDHQLVIEQLESVIDRLN